MIFQFMALLLLLFKMVLNSVGNQIRDFMIATFQRYGNDLLVYGIAAVVI